MAFRFAVLLRRTCRARLTRGGLALVLACAMLPGCRRHAAEQQGASSAALTTTAREVLAWLPDQTGTQGWKRAKAPQVYEPDNLWESIDGAAETYIGFGFQELVSVTFVHSMLGAEATVEVYRMADPLGAFGIYGQERNSRAHFIEVGAEGYAAPNILNFWNGQFYVKLRVTSADEPAAVELQSLARSISHEIGGPDAHPAQVPPFPSRDQVPHSMKYVPVNVLGQSFLARGFEAMYAASGVKPWRMVAVKLDSDLQATDALERYRKSVASVGRVVHPTRSPGRGGFVGADPYSGQVIAIRTGPWLLVALGGPSERVVIDMLTTFAFSLSMPSELP